MLARVRQDTPGNYVLLTVEKAINLLDKLYDTFFTAPRKSNVRLFTKHFIKIEFLDKTCRPLYKEFDAWPEISLEPYQPKDRKEKKESTNPGVTVNNNYNNTTQSREMTRKNRPRIKEKEDAEPRGGYCSSCGASFGDLAAHARSARHAAFARDAGNFLALDSLIAASCLPNGRRSLRHGRPGSQPDDTHYYKVVGVSTKLRSSGGFVPKRKDSSPTCNGAKPLVVKFRKVRRSELSVLSDEAEQFMFPKRASSNSSSSSDDEEVQPRRKTPPQPPPAPTLERRRLARPTALKEESSEEDSWLDDKRRRKRRAVPVVRRTRRAPCRPPTPEPEPPPEIELEETPIPAPAAAPVAEPEVSPLREEPVEKCMKWEDGKLKYTPAVEQLEFAFESVPRSEPWFETFQRQDQDKLLVKNVPRCFALYSKSAQLPYEMGQLPPLKPDCCPLSALPRREGREGRGPASAATTTSAASAARGAARYGTRGLKARRGLKRVAAVAALDPRPRKSPREHASTLAMLGSAGMRRRADDAKSTASEDTTSDALSVRPEPAPSAAQQASARLQQFLAEVFQDAEYDAPEDGLDGAAVSPAAAPDVLGLVSECDSCDLIRHEIQQAAAARRGRRRGRFKKKNRTGWPNKKKQKKGSRANSSEGNKTESSLDRSSAGSGDTARGTCDELSEVDEDGPPPEKAKSDEESQDEAMDVDKSDPDEKQPAAAEKSPASEDKADEKPLRLDVKVLLEDKKDKTKAEKVKSPPSVSESDESEERARKKKRALDKLGSWLQPVVRVARVDPAAARRLRSAGPGAAGAAGARSQRLR